MLNRSIVSTMYSLKQQNHHQQNIILSKIASTAMTVQHTLDSSVAKLISVVQHHQRPDSQEDLSCSLWLLPGFRAFFEATGRQAHDFCQVKQSSSLQVRHWQDSKAHSATCYRLICLFILGGPLGTQELDSMILVDPSSSDIL